MKPTQLLTILALVWIGALAPSVMAQDALKVGVAADDAALNQAITTGLTGAGFELVAADAMKAALAGVEIPADGIESAIAVKLGEATGAQVIVTAKSLGAAGIVAKILSTKNATIVGALAPDVAMLPAKVAESIEANQEMLLKKPE